MSSCVKQNSHEEFVLIEGGEYIVGSPDGEKGRESKGGEDRRVVSVSPFYIGATEVTEREYRRVMGGSASESNFPAVNVSWFDAVRYCNGRSEMEGYVPAYKITYGEDGSIAEVALNREGSGYRLPTADEWEVACRAGTSTAFNTGRSISRSEANFNWQKDRLAKGKGLPKCGGKFSAPAVKEVGCYQPNRWGLYDMHGNVSEWCWAALKDKNYVPKKGGSWFDGQEKLESSFIFFSFPEKSDKCTGFRVVRYYENN